VANARPEPQPTAAPAEAAPPSTSHSPPQQARRLAETYLAALVREIERHRFYPRVSRRLNEEGTVVVRFIIQRDGRLTDIAIDNSSGSRRLDEAALQTLGKTTPFEPMPAVLGREQLSLTVPIVYHLQR
jgi:protein TonB